MDPKKLAFLTSMMQEANGKNKDNMMPFLLSLASRANSEGVSFSDEETEMIYQEMKKNLSPEQASKMEMIRMMMKKK